MSVTQVQTSGITNDAVTTAKINFETALVPVGGIIMWSGAIADIPTGWRLCNGNNGTPNLQDRFIVGAGSGYAVAATGGSANATLVAHTHSVTSTSASAGGVFKSFFISINRILKFPPNDVIDSFSDGPPGGPFADGGVSSVGRGVLNVAGSSATNANLPPYYALAFIMRVS